MKITLKPVLWEKDIDKEGKAPIAISIAGGSKRTYYNTKLKIYPANWNDGRVKKSEKDYDIINANIDNMIATAQREVLNMMLQKEDITLDKVKALFNPTLRKSGSFFKFYDEYIELQKSRHTPGYCKHLDVERKSFMNFAGEKLGFTEVTHDLLERYEMSLVKKEGSKLVPVAVTTRHTKMKRVKEVVDRAVDRGFISSQAVSGYKLPRYVDPEAKYLTLTQVGKIEDMVYSGELENDPTMHQIACYFLVECLSGIRFSDWGRFKIEKLVHKRSFKVRAQKNKEPVYLPLDDFKRLSRIVDYIIENKVEFDLVEQTTNRLLKVLGSKIGMPDLTTHVGRHTCGTLLGEMRWSTRAIAEVLGISEKTAKRYVTPTRQGVKNEAEKYGGL